MLSQTTAVILAGGLGTRLRAAVADRPKVLALIHGRPFLDYLLDHLAAAGLRRVVLCTGFRAELVQATLGNSYAGMELLYSQEPKPLGTGGALVQALPLLSSDPVLVMNGDSFCDVDLGQFWSFHQSHQAGASLVLVEVPDCSRFGRVCSEDDGRISSFEEKGAALSSGWINAGIYLICRAWLDRIAGSPNPNAQVGPPGTAAEVRAISLEREVFPHWTGREFFGFRGRGRFLDIGTPETYAAAEKFFADKQP